MTIRTLTAALAFTALATAPAWAGSRFEMVTTTPDGAVTDTGEIKAEDGKLAMEMAGGGAETEDMRMIFRGDFDPAVMYVIDDGDQTYMTMDSQQISNTMASVQTQMQAAMEQAMAGMTPEQRAQMESIMGGQGGMPGMGGMGGGMMGMPAAPTIQIVPNGQSRSVNGVSTQGYQVLVDGEIASVIWAAPVGSVSGAADLAEGFAGMQGFLAEMPFVGDSAAMYDINAMDGKIPLQTENYENGMVTSITTIGQGQSATFTEADFMPDASYAEQSMFDGFR